MLIGIEIGGTKLQLVAGDTNGNIKERRRFNVDKARGGEGIREQIAGALPELLALTKARAIGVGFGGPVDCQTGQICCSHQIEGWSEFPISDWLKKISGLPVKVDNDANTAAFGEALCGAGKGFNPVFYITMGSGVGGGLTVNGEIYHGAKPGEAEIGHVRLDRSGTIVEERCSGWAIDRRIREACAAQPNTKLAELTRGMTRNEASQLSPALNANDPLALQILEETAQDLAFALSHVTHLFHPAVIVLGGGVSLIGEPLRAEVEHSLHRFVMEAFHPVPRVRLAGLGEDAVPVGALKLAALAK